MELRIMYLITIMNLAYFIIYHIQSAIKIKYTKGVFWTYEDSAYFDRMRRFDFKLASIVIGRSFLQMFSQFILF